jgi:hypothetical protein
MRWLLGVVAHIHKFGNLSAVLVGISQALLLALSISVAQASTLDDIVELLRLSIECPLEPYDGINSGRIVRSRSESNKYLGDDRVLKIEHRMASRLQSRSGEFFTSLLTRHASLEFRLLALINIMPPDASVESRYWQLQLVCSEVCASITESSRNFGQQSEKSAVLRIDFCDQERASRAKLAVDELVHLAQAPKIDPDVSRQKSIDEAAESLGLMDITGKK